MTEKDTDRPLTRRERRLLESGEQPTAEAPVEASETVSDDAPSLDDAIIEISPFDEDGRPRSRREIRQLREEALAKLQPVAEEAERDEASATEEAERDEASETSEEAELEEPSAVDEEPSSADVPTEALSLEDLQEIERDKAGAKEPEVILDPVDEETVREPELPTAPEETYSFPDIQPLEEDLPVFEDPATRSTQPPLTEDPDSSVSTFTDVIERAVADETGSVHGGSSSLILPTIPASDTLAGPIGTTGELFVTGSIELPKALGETGGHSGLQDSVADSDEEEDPVELLELSSLYETSEFDSAPVSAKQAVSTRSTDKTGAVTPEVQKGSKVPLALALTGGGLLVALVAGGIWLALSGIFG